MNRTIYIFSRRKSVNKCLKSSKLNSFYVADQYWCSSCFNQNGSRLMWYFMPRLTFLCCCWTPVMIHWFIHHCWRSLVHSQVVATSFWAVLDSLTDTVKHSSELATVSFVSVKVSVLVSTHQKMCEAKSCCVFMLKSLMTHKDFNEALISQLSTDAFESVSMATETLFWDSDCCWTGTVSENRQQCWIFHGHVIFVWVTERERETSSFKNTWACFLECFVYVTFLIIVT